MKVAALAQSNDLDVAPHGAQEVHIHLVAAIPNGLILEYYRTRGILCMARYGSTNS
ncbi:MAG: hypothetical protein CM1200mP39_22630 [Dehalococcoidia bacterium]|nr:MAG: hypothetical protein CM1200mP39_22630 [Dehalococcoidia bacterium]